MLYDAEKLGRAPVLRPIQRPEMAVEEDWRGERHIRIPRNPHAGSGLNMVTNRVNKKKAALIERRGKVASMSNEGMKPSEIARELGCSETSIWNDLKSLGMKAGGGKV